MYLSFRSMNTDPFFKPLGQMVPKAGRVRPKIDEAAPVEDEPPAPAAPVEEKPKPKIAKLSNPLWEAGKVGFNEETPISVDVELPPEVAHKKKVSFELFAKTPRGPERISQGDAMAEDGKAIFKIPVYIPNYRDEGGDPLRDVEYYFIARHSEAEPLDASKSPKRVEEMAERVLEMHILQNVTFATGKSFIRTSQAAGLKALGEEVKAWKGRHPEGKLAVFGHADAVGEELSNKQLSERRAKSVQAYLAKDAKSWEELYGGEKWGLAAVQELLKHLGHDPGVIDGQDGPKTQAAVKDFQAKKGLGETGAADAKTREALFLAYFEGNGSPASAAKDFDAIDGKAFTGCSEFNLIEKTEGACEPNRRVAVLLLKVSKNFPINYPCKQGAIMPCQKQAGLKGERKTPGFRCRFYDTLVVERKGSAPSGTGKLKWAGIKEGEELKQYVNLKAEKPAQGPERTLEVEVEGGSDGTKVYWKVTAGKDNSKRNDPKAGAKADAKGALKEFAGGVAELETEVKGGKAAMVLACGLAGGDSFKVEVGLAKGKADGAVTLVNWRKLYYQLSHHKDLTPPSMATAVKNLKSVFIEWEAQPAHRHDLMGNGKVVVGNHNAAKFHAFLKSDKVGQCAHIIFCDKQYDGLANGKNIVLEAPGDFKSNSGILKIGDPDNNLAVPNPPVQEGAKLMLEATWKNPATGKHGTLTDDPGKVSDEIGLATWVDENHWKVDLPKNASPTSKDPVKVKLKCTGASGPWGGDGGTAPHNLIVIDFDDTIHSMCVMHELGHIMNMVPLAGEYKAPPGLALNHKYAYAGKGGAGSHCSFDIDKTTSTAERYVDGACIMFHQLTLACKLAYCPECAPFVKAQALGMFQELKG